VIVIPESESPINYASSNNNATF